MKKSKSLSQQIRLLIIALTVFPLVLIGIISYQNHVNYLQEQALVNLRALQVVQKERLLETVAFQFDRIALIASRTKLRNVLSAYDPLSAHAVDHQETLSQILLDGISSVEGIKEISLFSLDSEKVVSVQNPKYQPVAAQNTLNLDFSRDRYHSIERDSEQSIELNIYFNMQVDGRVIGQLLARIDGRSFLQIFNNYDGFGATGEAILAKQNEAGDYVFLHDLRFDKNAALLRVIPKNQTQMPITHAFSGEDRAHLNVSDYRNQKVLAVSTFIEELGWGMVVKKDVSEILQAANEEAWLFACIVILILCLVIILSFLISKKLTAPLKNFSKLAMRVAEGNLHERVSIHANNELGQFARAFNTMLEKNEQLYYEMDEKVIARTAELTRSKNEAQSANKAKSEFLASMSHEIRTPMNGVMGMLALLEQSELKESQKQYVKLGKSCASALLNLINDILDFSKIEAGKIDLEIIDFNVRQLIDDVAKSMSLKVLEKNLELIIDSSKIEQAAVRGDPSRIKQILTNLLGNAVKFTDKGEIFIQASLRPFENGDLIFECSVKDSGIGIDADTIDKLFDKFTQADSSTTRKYGGTGLGLSISKKLCQLMGGDITVKSSPDKGSIFTFSLVLQASEQNISVLPVGNIKGLNVLVVDDNATNRRVIEDQLSIWGVNSESASSARAALALLDENVSSQTLSDYDVAILDMQMPDIDGMELAETIRRDSRFDHLKLIMMTSIGFDLEPDLFLEKGFQGWFTKPVTTEDLFKVLSICADTQNQKQQHLLTSNYVNSLANEMVVQENSASAEELPNASFNILLVEDNAINQLVAISMLKNLNMHYEIASNGLEAIELLKNSHVKPFDLILMDCQMPEMDGYEATKCIRAGTAGDRYTSIPIVAMTANVMKGDKQACLDAGMDDYLSKPVDAKVLKTILKRVFDK